MNTILRIFRHDFRGICRNMFALIIALGLCIIPSLYAWFNIYSNWDPYANTSSIKIAVYSEDEGFTPEGKEKQNMGDSIIDNLRENDKLGWTFTKDKESTIDGVKSGEYYAAIIIGSNFSRSMINFLNDNMETPSVTYYENAKKNAIASKITQSGMSTLQETINETFIETVVVTILNSTDADELTKNNVLSDIADKLKDISDNISEYDSAIKQFSESNNNLSATLKKTDSLVGNIQSDMSDEQLNSSKSSADSVIDDYMYNINSSLSKLTDINSSLGKAISDLRDKIASHKDDNSPIDKQDIISSLNDLKTQMNNAYDISEQLVNTLKPVLEHFKEIDNNNGGYNQVLYDSLISSLDIMPKLIKGAAQTLDTFIQWYEQTDTSPKLLLNRLDNVLAQCQTSISSLDNILTTSITGSVDKVGSLFKTSIATIYDSLIDASNSLSSVSTIINGADSTLSNVNITLETMSGLIDNIKNTLDKADSELNVLKADGKYELVQKLLDKDSSEYGEFFSSPVKVTTENVYEAVNYGTAVAPFYTTLALWVGGLLLTALIKTSPDDLDEFKNATLTQKYFGRYIIFWLMGQIQAIITVLGDLYLLKIYCVHPGIFMLTASIVSFAFTLLIYTLTLSFGDVGKALAVVLVVIQIAGSSGTYPIELLPSFFRNVYIYFPFPYAINAIRECVSGFYKYDYFILMGQLMLFVIGTLFLGLLIRKPFMKLNHYMHHRMHDTKMM
jgi:putative membrane protein